MVYWWNTDEDDIIESMYDIDWQNYKSFIYVITIIGWLFILWLISTIAQWLWYN